MNKNARREGFLKYIYLLIFSIALAFLEATVVVYLRKIYYPEGFHFPLPVSISGSILIVEIFRELSTIVIIFCAGLICGKKFMDRFSYFIFTFAVWDIFYYVFLKVILNWPSSFLTWDILFLIPIPWTAPVLFPILSSIAMIGISIFLYNLYQKYGLSKFSALESSLLSIGAFLIFISFIWDYLNIIFVNFKLILNGASVKTLSAGYVPQRYNWEIFLMGLLIAISSMFVVYRRVKNV